MRNKITEYELQLLLKLVDETKTDLDIAETVALYLDMDRDIDNITPRLINSRGVMSFELVSYRDNNMRLISPEDWVRLRYLEKHNGD